MLSLPKSRIREKVLHEGTIGKQVPSEGYAISVPTLYIRYNIPGFIAITAPRIFSKTAQDSLRVVHKYLS